jgi:hypothetical protein
MSELVAGGQNTVSPIVLVQKNSSGLSGSVTWDGTSILSSSVTIGCEDFSSSSSTSSLDSSSTSSRSSFSSSSTSSACCTNLICLGTECSHFPAWTFAGNTKNNTSDCSMYVAFDYDLLLSLQKISVYKHPSMGAAYLVAEGQNTVTPIILAQKNSSGLTGSVTWDLTPIFYPASAVLDCEFSSSSSTSSQSSMSESSISRSSLSSVSSSSSSLSTASSFSSSSTSNSSSSSSSSMDSSSTSSESVGNVSSSSSSSFGGWNKTKPLILGMSAINAAGVINEMAQTISLTGDSYDIGKVFCYFYGPYGTDSSYTIHLDVYTCNDSGEPLNPPFKSTTLGSSVTGNGWYSFDVNISGDTPSNKYLSFVVWQDGGNEDDYVLWGYYYATTTTGTKALFSNDGSTWQYQEGVIRSLKLIGNFNAYDLTEFRILTPPADRECIVHGLTGGEYDGTKFVAGSYQYNPDRVIIDNPDLISSIVIDSSGSMGWNDRFSTRQDFVNGFIQRLKNNYPSDVIFDIVKFGAQVANTNSITSDIGVAATINVDLTSPTRTAFSFVVDPASATSGSVYSANCYSLTNTCSFTVSNTIISGTILTCSGLGDSVPFTAGTLTKVTGTGDTTIEYLSYSKASISDGMVAYGFRDFEEDHSCNMGEITVAGVSYDVSLQNWQPLTNSGAIYLTLGNNGPKNSSSVDFISSQSLVLRKPIIPYELLTTKITSDAVFGSTVISVDDASNFSIGDSVDFIDKDLASLGHTITNTSSTTLTVQPSLVFNISSWDNNGGIAQQSNLSKSTSINGTTANIEFRDVSTTRNITFFMQTINGLSLEYDISPFNQWYINNLYWLDETAILPISVFDVNGNPFPDGTKIIFYVGDYPSDSSTSGEIPSQGITQNAAIGSSKIYVVSTEGYAVDQNIDILNNLGNIQTVTITEVGSDTIGDYIKFDPVLQLYNFNVADGSKIIPSITAQDSSNAGSEVSQSTLLSSGLSLVDVTPIYTGESLDPSLLQPYDILPTDPSMTYDQLNLDSERVRNGIRDIPSINGYAVLRVLPITEDNLKTTNEKNSESTRLLKASPPPIFTDQTEQNQGDAEQSVSTTTTTTTLSISKGDDYNIDNPVYLLGGSAQSSMTTFATELEEVDFDGINVPGVDPLVAKKLLVKKYDIHPAIVIENSNKVVVAKQYLTPFEIYFTPPIAIYSDYTGGQVSFVVPRDATDECPAIFNGYETVSMNGVYASGDGFRIDYVISDRNTVANGQLKIRIYSNTVVDIAEVVQQGTAVTRQDLNVTLPKSSQIVEGQTVITQPLTDISAWRAAVENNPASQVIEDASTNNTVATNDRTLNVIGQAQADLETAGYISHTTSSSTNAFEYYTKPWEWTKAVQYDTLQEITIDIVNGKASITIPESDVVSLLMVQASVYFGDNNQFESIRSDIIPVANPIDISAISPSQIMAQGSDVTYEIGTSVIWMNNVAADNIVVSFDPASTPSLPAVSKTDSGWAGGVYLGPHSVVEMTCPDPLSESTCPCYGQYENINITVSYLGYSRTVSRIIEWTGNVPEPDSPPDDTFYFNVQTNMSTGWADGSSISSMLIDLNDFFNSTWIELQYPFDDKNRDRMKGYQQDINQTPNALRISSGSLNSTQSQASWVDDLTYVNISGLDQNIGHVQPSSSVDLSKDNPPWSQNITMRTGYKYYNSDNILVSRIGYAYRDGIYPYTYTDPDTGAEKTIIPCPQANFSEPLGISLSIESYDNEFIRDGVDSPNIVADVTWEGLPITGKFTKNKGQLDETIIDYAFPDVTFKAGICSSGNANIVTLSDGTVVTKMVDTRNISSGCLTIGSHPDVSLSSYSTVVSLCRTDINNHGTGTHTHACSVDSDGDGITTSTIRLSGESIADHTHTITNYIALPSGIPSHQHNLRSVAITKLNPLVNPNVNISINGYVIYDPTNCTPYGSEPKVPFKNRMMFATLYINSSILNRELLLTMTMPEGGYTANLVTETDRGINIILNAMFSQYSIEDYPGHWIVVPAKSVSDGTRVIWNIDCFKALPASQTSNILVIRPDAVRKYMYIRVKATVYAEELQASTEKVLTISSNLQWIPSVSGLVLEPTNDDIYLANAISQITTIGASQIHDAVKMASQRIIQFQTDNSSWKNAKKAIFLLTDGDENTSEYSIDQAIDNVNFIDGECEVPVIPIRLGYSYGSDEVILNKYSSETCGSTFHMIDASAQDIIDITDDIITSSFMGVNNGTYTNTIDLGKDNLGSSVSINNILVPINSRALFKVRFSSDNVNWTDWSELYDSSVVKDFALNLEFKGRYFQYQVHLCGNENFESPELYAGLNLCYYVVQTFTVFFQPVDLDINTDEYLASIHITHKATIPPTSIINYGYAQFNSTDIIDYASVTRPWITPDRHTIILTRYNELLLTSNYQKYTAINYGWPEGAQVEVYRVNKTNVVGELISPTEYAINNKTGEITFYNSQSKDDKFVLCVYFDPVFRIICNVINYGPDPVIIDHIGVLYNVTKRIPTVNNGIIHTSISERLQ